MASLNSGAPGDRAASILGSLSSKGVRLWSENGQLRYEAPRGVLSTAEIQGLRAAKGQILSHLLKIAHPDTTGPEREETLRIEHVPLAFSQLARWNMIQEGEVPCVRQIACAHRLRGRLDIQILRRSLAEVIRRHSALRTRIVCCDGVPAQVVSPSADCELEVVDIAAMPAGRREAEVLQCADRFILRRIDPATDSLLAVKVLRLQATEHVLIVAMEHMISDEISLGILMRELYAVYSQLVRGVPISLPPVRMQFPDYAILQRDWHGDRLQRHGTCWEQLAAGPRLLFPERGLTQPRERNGWGTVPFDIPGDMKAALAEWSRLRRTTLPMTVFTVFVGLVCRWCDVSDTVMRYQSDGRTIAEVESAIGFFSSALYPRVSLAGNDSFVELMGRVTAAYCRAHEHADHSYLITRQPRPAFTRNPQFNWIPGSSTAHFKVLQDTDALVCSSVRVGLPVIKELALDCDPAMILYDTSDGVAGGIYFPRSEFSTESMERFAANMLAFIAALLERPDERVTRIPLI